MTNLEKLAAIFEARTPGPWDFDMCGDVYTLAKTEYLSEADLHMFKRIGSTAFFRAEPNADSQFIATAGSIADEVMGVLKAAYRVHHWEDSPDPKAHLEYDDAIFDLGVAKIALDKRLCEVLGGIV